MTIESAKTKTLEQLCRELQSQNKLIRVESQRLLEEERQKRIQLADQYQTSIQGIQTHIEQQEKDRAIILKDNDELRTHLKSLLDQVQLRSDQQEKEAKIHEIEKQLAGAKLQQQIELYNQQRTVVSKIISASLSLSNIDG